MLTDVPVREVMVEDVLTASTDDSVATVAEAMTERDVGCVVVTEDDEPVGIVTYSDVVRLLATDEPTPGEVGVGDCMSSGPVTVDPDATVEDVARTLIEAGVKRLPVVEDDRLVGIVTVTDVSYYLPLIAIGRRPHRRTPPRQAEVAFDADEWTTDLEAGEETSVGDVVRFTKTLDDEDVRAFARASGDTNRLHLDDEFAAGTRFGERIAHGTLAAGLLSAALARLPGLTIYLSQDLTFRGPVPIGATVTAICEVTDELGSGRYRVSTSVCRDEETVIEGEATVLIEPLADSEPLAEADV